MTKTQETHYERLLGQISSLYESTLIMGIEAQRRHKVKTFWQMGQRIAAALGTGKVRVP